jgi:hypothetical protein
MYQALELSDGENLVVGQERVVENFSERRAATESGIHVVPPLEFVAFIQLPT